MTSSNSTFERECFFIAPIGEEGSPIRRRSDPVHRHLVSPAAKAVGLRAVPADEPAAPGRITNQIIDHAHDEPALPFDLAQMRVIRYDHTSLDSAERCRQTLVEHLRAGLEGAADLEADGESQWQGFAKETGIPRFKYGYLWVLRDKESGEPRHDFDHRPLSETGIRPGMRLEAIRPPRRLFRQHP